MSKKLKYSLLSVLILLFALTSFFIFSNEIFKKASAESCELELTEEIRETYVLGSTFDVPSGKLLYDGEEIDAESHKIVTPSGYAYSKNQVTLSEAGKYVIYYYKNLSDKVLTGEKSFVVSDKAFSVGSSSTIEYGTDDRIAGKEGLQISLAAGDTFTCNIPLNLNGLTKQTNFLEFFALPEIQKVADANEVYVKLTDAYDPSNYVLIKSLNTADMGATQVGELNYQRTHQSVRAYNQSFTALRVIGSYNNYGVMFDGYKHQVELGGNVGYRSRSSLAAYDGYDKDPFSFSIDYANKVVYGSPKWYVNDGTNVIADLDESAYFTNLWEGFSKGECYLSIYANAYNGTTFNFMISDIYGIDLTLDDIIMDKKPIVEVSTEKDVYAIVDKPFNIFQAKAYDIYSGIKDCSVSVLYDNNSYVDVIDGTFTPKREGSYTLIYRYEDRNGTVIEEKVFIKAYSASKTDIKFGNKSTPIQSGKTIVVEAPTITKTSGDYSLTVKAVLKSDTSKTYDLTMVDGAYEFCPLYAGAYDLIYEITDYSTTISKTEQIEVVSGDYILVEEPELLEYFINGAKYQLPQVNCYKLSSGAPEIKSTEIYYSFDGNSYSKLNGELTIASTKNVFVSYRCEGNEIKSYIIPSIDVGYKTYEMEVYKYFNSKDGSFVFESGENSTQYATYSATTEGAQLQFINKVAISNFAFNFSVPEKNFNTLSLTLRSGEQVLNLEIRPISETESIITVNGTVSATIGKSFSDGKFFNINYNKNTNIFTFTNMAGKSESYIIPTSVFQGFEASDAYFSVAIKDVTEGQTSSLRIAKINNQNMQGSKVDDYNAPEVSSSLESGVYKIGQKIVLKDIKVIDVLYVDTIDAKLSVYDPSGKVLKDDNGVSLNEVSIYGEYSFTLNQYGVYLVEISMTDDFEYPYYERESYTFNVIDDIAPEITVDESTEYVVIGDTLTVRSFTVTDNLDDENTIKKSSIIIAPDGTSHSGKYSLEAKLEGTYEVVVYAVDKEGNMALKTYEIIVSKAK